MSASKRSARRVKPNRQERGKPHRQPRAGRSTPAVSGELQAVVEILGQALVVGWVSDPSADVELRVVDNGSGRWSVTASEPVFDGDKVNARWNGGGQHPFAALVPAGHRPPDDGDGSTYKVRLELAGDVLSEASLVATTPGLVELAAHPHLRVLHDCLAVLPNPVPAEIVAASIAVAPLKEAGPQFIDNMARCGGAVVYAGWIADLQRRRFHVVDDRLRDVTTSEEVVVRSRPDVHRHLLSERVPVGSGEGHGFTIVLRESPGAGRSVYLVEPQADGMVSKFYGPLEKPKEQNEALAADMVVDPFGGVFSTPPETGERLFRPLVARDLGRPAAIRREYGPDAAKAPRPRFSIIVPFYGDAFFLSCVFHLYRLLDDRFEVIVVVDDPKLWPQIAEALDRRQSSIPVRTVLLRNHQNYGYATANNLGAEAASGEVLVLMNSDILVENADAIAAAAEEIAGARTAGRDLIVGFMLRYEDDTVQHVGMSFARDPTTANLYLAQHPMKGMPAALYDGGKVKPAQAVTGALLAISSDLYRRLGGLDPAFVRGDFEDADLCLRARRSGAEIVVHAAPGLYHLERQSVTHIGGSKFRAIVTYLNCIEFNRRWATHLASDGRVLKRGRGLRQAEAGPVKVRAGARRR